MSLYGQAFEYEKVAAISIATIENSGIIVEVGCWPLFNLTRKIGMYSELIIQHCHQKAIIAAAT